MSEAAAVSSASNLIRVLATIVFAAALPIFLVTSAVRTVTLSESFYLREFNKYRVGEVTALGVDELTRVAEAFIGYFQSRPGPLDLQVQTLTGPVRLFNEREVQHMVDVQLLMQRVFQATWLALGALALSALVILAAEFSSGILALLRALALGGIATAAVVGLAGAASLVDFNRLFMFFHFMSFSNDLWLLDPRTDRLIQLFPTGFFYDAGLQIGVRSAAIGGAMAAVSFIGLRVIK